MNKKQEREVLALYDDKAIALRAIKCFKNIDAAIDSGSVKVSFQYLEMLQRKAEFDAKTTSISINKELLHSQTTKKDLVDDVVKQLFEDEKGNARTMSITEATKIINTMIVASDFNNDTMETLRDDLITLSDDDLLTAKEEIGASINKIKRLKVLQGG